VKEDTMNPIRPARRRWRAGVAALLAAVCPLLLAVLAAPAAAAAGPSSVIRASTTWSATVASTSCPTVYWGSLPKVSAATTVRPITNVRTGQHPCFDRMVVDLGSGSGTAGYQVRYVDRVYSQGRGTVVPVAGGARIEVVVHAPAYRVSTGTATYRPADSRHLTNVTGYATFRQLAWGGSFEGQTTIALGVRARLPMRVFTLAGPGTGQRLVIDVAHHW
jgi:hypothetical protein